MIDSKYVKKKEDCRRKPETFDQVEDKYNEKGEKKWNKGKFFKDLDEGELR